MVIVVVAFRLAAMANPIQQGLKPDVILHVFLHSAKAAMANPIQQGLKQYSHFAETACDLPQWLIQYNKD